MNMMAFILSLDSPRTVVPDPDPAPETIALVLDDSVVSYSGANTRAGVLAGGHNLYTPRKIWYNGKTYHLYHGIYQSDGYGQAYIQVYDENDGIHRPYRVGSTLPTTGSPGVGDSHTTPSFNIDNSGNLYAFQERTHDSPIDIYKALENGFNNFALLAEKINPGSGATAQSSYHNVFKDISGNGVSWCRMTKLNEAYSGGHPSVVRASAGFETWGLLYRVGTNPRPDTDEGTTDLATRIYPHVPLYRVYVPSIGKYIVLNTLRNDNATTGLGIWNKYYLSETDDFVNFDNLFGTPYSHNTASNNYITEAIYDANFRYYNSGATTNNSYIPTATVSLAAKVYIVTGDEHTGDLLLHIIDRNARTLVTKDLNISGYVFFDPATNQANAVKHMAFIEDGQYLEMAVLIDDGTYNKVHLFRSYDDGETFLDRGDMTPEVTDRDVQTVVFPMNYHDIPNNRNFILTFYTTDPTTANTRLSYIKRAVKGVIQTETPNIVVPAANLSTSANLFDYVAIDGQISRSGNNVTGLTDQFGLRNATGSNNPQWNGTDAITLNGTNQDFSIATTGLTALTKCTIFAVARTTAIGTILLGLYNNADSGAFTQFNVADSNAGFAPSHIFKISGQSTLRQVGQQSGGDNQWHLIAWVPDGRCKTDIYVDGMKQYYQDFNYTTAAEIATRGRINYGTVNSIKIGRQDLSSTDTYTPLQFKRITMYSTVFDLPTFLGLQRKIADLHGITLNYGYS